MMDDLIEPNHKWIVKFAAYVAECRDTRKEDADEIADVLAEALYGKYGRSAVLDFAEQLADDGWRITWSHCPGCEVMSPLSPNGNWCLVCGHNVGFTVKPPA